MLRSTLKTIVSSFSGSKPLKKWNLNQINHVSTSKVDYKRNKTYDLILNKNEEALTLHNSYETMNFPFVWLRDNCQCDRCFHAVTKSRIINWENFNINPMVERYSMKNDETINIIWSDEHSSDYQIKWLCERSFLKANRDRYTNSIYQYERIEWSKNYFESVLKKFDYQEIIKSDEHLRDWLEHLSIYGVAITTGVPSSNDSTRKLAERVDFIKKTHYGEEFIVQDKSDTTNEAYRSGNLQMHTDLPYYEHSAGVILLHYLTQSMVGGQNLLCDGLYIANQLKKNRKDCYDILAKTLVNWEDFGEERGNRFHSIFRSPVICEDMNGRIVRINFSTTQRGSHFDVPYESVKPWYEAYRIFVNMAYEESARFKVSEGCILSFDNSRLVHGRIGYNDTKNNIRCLIGAYLDWDYINSRIRVLNTK